MNNIIYFVAGMVVVYFLMGGNVNVSDFGVSFSSTVDVSELFESQTDYENKTISINAKPVNVPVSKINTGFYFQPFKHYVPVTLRGGGESKIYVDMERVYPCEEEECKLTGEWKRVPVCKCYNDNSDLGIDNWYLGTATEDWCIIANNPQNNFRTFCESYTGSVFYLEVSQVS